MFTITPLAERDEMVLGIAASTESVILLGHALYPVSGSLPY